VNENNDNTRDNNEDRIILQQLGYFFKREEKNPGYIKALYLHHLLDFFKETHVNIQNIDKVYEKFLQDKVIAEISNVNGEIINFHNDIDEIFELLRANIEELYEDLKGEYTANLEK
jgi:hypothetical protein